VIRSETAKAAGEIVMIKSTILLLWFLLLLLSWLILVLISNIVHLVQELVQVHIQRHVVVAVWHWRLVTTIIVLLFFVVVLEVEVGRGWLLLALEVRNLIRLRAVLVGFNPFFHEEIVNKGIFLCCHLLYNFLLLFLFDRYVLILISWLFFLGFTEGLEHP
jgi:hypothetical protein